MEKSQEKKVGAFGIGMIYIGTIIGAGFASGQEVLQFFASFGTSGIIGACLVAFCFIVLGIITMLTARHLNCNAYEKVVSPNSKLIENFMNLVITFFSYGVMVIMFAGAGSLLQTVLGLDAFIGSLIMVVIVIVVGLFGSEGTINSFSFIVPLLLVIALGTCALAIFKGPDSIMNVAAMPEFSSAPHWAVGALLYVSYNTICAMTVLVPLGHDAKSKRHAIGGGLIGGGILGLLGALLCVALLKNIGVATTDDMPMYAIAAALNPYLGYAYGFVLIAAIFTTAAGLMYGLVERLMQYNTPVTKSKTVLVLVISITGLVGSKVGFTTLIGTLYPLTGYLGFVIIASLIFNYFRVRNLSGGMDAVTQKGKNGEAAFAKSAKAKTLD